MKRTILACAFGFSLGWLAGEALAGVALGQTTAYGGIGQIFNDFYVANGGTDVGTCTLAAEPCATLNYVTGQALSLPSGGNVDTIHMAAGSGWNESVNVMGMPPGSATTGHNNELVFEGEGPTTQWNGPTNSCGTLIANSGANVAVENMAMFAEGNPCQSILFAQLGGMIQVYGGMTFGPTYAQIMHAEGSGSQIEVWDGFTVDGGAGSLASAISNALIEFNPNPIEIIFSGNPNFPYGLFTAAANGTVYLGHGVSFNGAESGPQYTASQNGVVYTDGAGCAFIPGSPGSAGWGGICN